MVIKVISIITICALLAPLAIPAIGSPTLDSSIYLPFISKANTNPIHDGTATWYHATGDGACMFGESPSDLMVAAMNHVEYGNADYCGAFLYVVGPSGSVMVRVVDLCPDAICGTGHLDLSEQAFAEIADPDLGYIPITWQMISPDIPGPIAYYWNPDSNPWWTAVQIRNHRNPILTLEYWDGSSWIDLPRTDWNFFIREDGENYGPYLFRVTDVYGNVLVDSGVPHLPGSTVDGAAQFPYGP